MSLTLEIRLPAVRVSDLAYELRPRHVDGAINSGRVRPRVVLQNLDHQARVVARDHARLQHPQEADLALGLAERSAGIDGYIRVQPLADGGDRRKGGADLE